MKDVRKVFCLPNRSPRDRESWYAAVHGVTKSQRLNNNSKEDLDLDLFLHLNVQLFYLCLFKKKNYPFFIKWPLLFRQRSFDYICMSLFLGSVFCCRGICSAVSLQLCLILCAPRTVAHQPPLSMGFSKQEYWDGLPFPPPGDLPHQRMKLMSLVSSVWACVFFTSCTTWENIEVYVYIFANDMWPSFCRFKVNLEVGKSAFQFCSSSSVLCWLF